MDNTDPRLTGTPRNHVGGTPTAARPMSDAEEREYERTLHIEKLEYHYHTFVDGGYSDIDEFPRSDLVGDAGCYAQEAMREALLFLLKQLKA